MASTAKPTRCEDCGDASLRIPDWIHDDAEIACSDCGRTFGTVRRLRELLEAALGDDPHRYADNDD